MSPTDLIKQASAIGLAHIPYEAFVNTQKALSLFVDAALFKRKDAVAILLGESGTAKTNVSLAVKKLVEENYAHEEARVACLTVPADVSHKVLMARFLRAVDDPWAEKGTGPDREARIPAVYRNKRVKLVVMDEGQRLFTRTGRDRAKVADSLTSLIQDLGLPVIMVGTDELEELRNAHEPLFRRSLIYRMSNFTLSTTKSTEEFKEVLKALNQVSARPFSNQIIEPPGLQLVIKATGGRIGRIIQLFELALQNACLEDAPMVNYACVENAARELRQIR